ncbi:hypothetical protein T4D_16244 [Trichinella pseudospiralis]|uniref:Uncharacterized protein n=1 Tax=Trichinella pseudospiralis TaxID=6337 RepID=A0A0V1DQV5_TRIPS|nr:hypothetical protein T4D_16244 [Trichinella pseudospiralis]
MFKEIEWENKETVNISIFKEIEWEKCCVWG